MEFVCVVCSKPADVYCHNDNAYLCAACDVTVHSAHALAASHHRTPVHCNGCTMSARNVPTDALSHSVFAGENKQTENDVDASFDADDWFAVPDASATGDAREVQSCALRGAASDEKYGMKKKENSFDIDFNCVPWDVPLGSDPLDIPFEFPLDVPSFESDLVPSVPSSPHLELDGEQVVDQELESNHPEAVKREEITDEDDTFMYSTPCNGGNGTVEDGISELYDAFQSQTGIDLNLDIPAPAVQESVKVVPAPVPVPLQAQTWIQTYLPHSLLPLDPAARAASLSDRRERVARFRAKKNSFHFKKTIRYASRKRYAEKRPRIKGRFARKDEIEAAIKAGVPLVA